MINKATVIARGIRAELLRFKETDRTLAGQCGLAAMLMATSLERPHALRTGFYMKFESPFGKRRRYPHRHAWCRVGTMIVDVTATQFDRRNRAVHVVRHDEDPRYIETASGADAIDDIMLNWCGRELEAYVALARKLRRILRSSP